MQHGSSVHIQHVKINTFGMWWFWRCCIVEKKTNKSKSLFGSSVNFHLPSKQYSLSSQFLLLMSNVFYCIYLCNICMFVCACSWFIVVKWTIAMFIVIISEPELFLTVAHMAFAAPWEDVGDLLCFPIRHRMFVSKEGKCMQCCPQRGQSNDVFLEFFFFFYFVFALPIFKIGFPNLG